VELGDRHIELEIGTIVVEGPGSIEEQALVAGVRTELVPLVSAHGLPDGLPDAIGDAVGRAVYGALSG
jgi:hypothetical protein